MKILQNKIFIGSVCILLASVIAFALLPNIYRNKDSTEKIIKLNIEAAAGTKIEENMLTEVEVGSYNLPDSVIKKKEDVIGKFTKGTITPDDLILKSKISDFAVNEKLDKILASGKKLMSVTLPSIAAGVANHLKSGDIITFVYYIDDKAVMVEELKNIEVYCIENDDAQNIEDKHSDEEIDHIASTLTVIVTDEQAIKLVEMEYSGKLHAMFEQRGKADGK